MAISKDKLIGKEGVSLEVDSVTSYLATADGYVTTTSAGGKVALDVSLAGGVNLDVNLTAAGDSVTAWLADGAGNALSSTSGALHVRLDSQTAAIEVEATALDIRALAFATDSVDVSGSSVTVSATDLDIRDLSAATDSVSSWMKDGTGNVLSSTAGALHVSLEASNATISAVQNGPWAVGILDDMGFQIEATSGGLNVYVKGADITDLDIRDLAFATDSVDVSGSSVTVSATALDIRALSSSSDSVIAYQGPSPYQISQVAVLSTNPYKLYALNSEQVDVTTTAALLSAQTLIPEQMLIQNLGNRAIYVGKSGVTTATGIRVAAGATFVFETGGENPFAVTDSGTCDVRVIPYTHRASAGMPI